MQPERRLARLLAAIEAALGAGPDNRYAMAMVARALAVAKRDLEGGIDAPERALNLAVYGEATRSLDRLARDIRNRAINAGTYPDLPVMLARYVEDRLKRWNPDRP
jgi:hypothetical protein